MNKTILEILPGKSAHVTFEQAVEDTDMTLINEYSQDFPYSLWDLVEHIRLAQRDILEFMTSDDYTTPNWPDDYWPEEEGSEKKWYQSIQYFQQDRRSLIDMVYTVDLNEEIPGQPGYTYLREVLLVAQHSSYHIGQIVTLRRALGDWHRK